MTIAAKKAAARAARLVVDVAKLAGLTKDQTKARLSANAIAGKAVEIRSRDAGIKPGQS